MSKRFEQRLLLPDWAAILVTLAFIAICLYFKARPATDDKVIPSHSIEKK